jgi:clan AA aspartic protease
MITGIVVDYEAIIRISICGSDGQIYERDASIDTGFDGWLSLPADFIAMLGLAWKRRGIAELADGSKSIFDVYEANVIWDEKMLTIPIDEANSEPLIGMSLMEGYELTIQVVNGGIVMLKKLSGQ